MKGRRPLRNSPRCGRCSRRHHEASAASGPGSERANMGRIPGLPRHAGHTHVQYRTRRDAWEKPERYDPVPPRRGDRRLWRGQPAPPLPCSRIAMRAEGPAGRRQADSLRWTYGLPEVPSVPETNTSVHRQERHRTVYTSPKRCRAVKHPLERRTCWLPSAFCGFRPSRGVAPPQNAASIPRRRALRYGRKP